MKRELVTATRALFDERGAQDAPVEEIARAVGIQRGLIYRHFSSKEELYVLTVTDYLAELDGVLADALADGTATPAVGSSAGPAPMPASVCAIPRSWTVRSR